MKTILFILTSIIIMVSCEKNNNIGIITSTGMRIFYMDNAGNDLLDTATINHYKFEDMRIFHLINGEKVAYYESNLDAPRGIRLLDSAGTFRDTVMLSVIPYSGDGTESGEFLTTTFLQLSETDTDTIRCIIDMQENLNLLCTKVWYNDVLKWEWGTRREFKIVK